MSAPTAEGSGDAPDCRLMFRSKDGIEVFSMPSERSEEAKIQKAATRTFLMKGMTSFQALHPDGSCAFVHKPEKGIFKLALSSNATVLADAPFLKETARVQIMDISPKGSFLLTWERAKEGEEPNLKLWSTSTGAMVTGFRQKALKRSAWPNLKWTDDESFAFLMGTNEVKVYPGAAFHSGDEVRYIDRLRIQGIASMSLGPSGSRILFTSFVPKDNNKPARAGLHEYPPKAPPMQANANYPALTSKSLFLADEMAVHWSPKGDTALLSLQTSVDTSGQSYYGSTSLFLMSPMNADTLEVPLQQQGPVLAVEWMPNPDKPPCFVVTAGKMPSMTSLHNGATGKATFLFGNAHRNTICWAPHGRFLCVAGFGNLAGGMTFWDRNKEKQIPPGDVVTASCTVGYGWSPDSRLFAVSTTSPRMNVDNGAKVYRYNGDQVMSAPWDNSNYGPDRLLEVAFLPALSGIYPDRPQSPTLKDRANGASGATAAPKPAGRYVPPGARGGAARGGGSLADRMRREKEGKMIGAQKVKDKPQATVGASGKKVVGLVPAQTKSKSAMRREKQKQKKEEEAARLVLEAKVKQEQQPAVDPAKRAKKLNKTLRQIEDLKSKDPASLNDDQRSKIAMEKEIRDELASLKL